METAQVGLCDVDIDAVAIGGILGVRDKAGGRHGEDAVGDVEREVALAVCHGSGKGGFVDVVAEERGVEEQSLDGAFQVVDAGTIGFYVDVKAGVGDVVVANDGWEVDVLGAG